MRLKCHGEPYERAGVVPRNGAYEVLCDHPLREVLAARKLFARAVFENRRFGGGHVEEKSRFRLFWRKSEPRESRDEQIHSARVLGGNRARDERVFKPLGRGELYAEELSGVGVVLDVAVRLYDKRVAADPADSPTRHVVALGERVELYGHVLSALDLQY